ncbi:hypothetical protein [Candidatus Nitrospira salsa]
MKPHTYLIMLFALSLWLVPVAQAGEFNNATRDASMDGHSLEMVSGIIKDVEGELFTVQDSQGIHWKIQVDRYTDTIGKVQEGAMITAMVESNGHAKLLKVLPRS